MEVAPAQQCYFWQEIHGCSRHCAQERCHGEAAMISFRKAHASSRALTASNVAEHPCKCVG